MFFYYHDAALARMETEVCWLIQTSKPSRTVRSWHVRSYAALNS